MNQKTKHILISVLLLSVFLFTAFSSSCGARKTEPAQTVETVSETVTEKNTEAIAESANETTPEAPDESASGQTEAPTTETAPETAPGLNISISLAEAFGEESLTEGTLSPDEIGFYFWDWETDPRIEVLPREEVLAWHAAQRTLPRPHYFESELPESFRELYPFLDYAYVHSYSRVCIPTTEFPYSDFSYGWKYLPMTYNVNNEKLSAALSGAFELESGEKLQYITIVINGMDWFGRGSEYLEAMAAAEALVAEIPEGSSEYDKALYLYRWLTENVSFYDGDYYSGDWNLLYDALIRKKTVCAGFVEAMDVLYNLAGIECFMVGGSVYVNDCWSTHVWNAAKVDGEYYLFDALMDAETPPSKYSYFGVSEETVNSTYPRSMAGGSEKYCPSCTRDLPLPE